jgi:hypothetical protein
MSEKSVKVEYKNGFKGVVSAAVGKILEAKKEAKIIGEVVEEALDRAKLVKTAIKLGLAKTADELDSKSDKEIDALIKGAK